MAKAEGLTLKFDGPEKLTPEILETFPYEGPRQWVEYKTQEFSAVCPFSGLPDFGELIVSYIPNKKCVELKSYKYYLLSYRNVGIYQEHAAAKLFEDLKKCLDPKSLRIKLTYQTRGGIDTSCEVSTEDT